ncbi:PREDICTED: F-box/kelch-repeat protein At1g64840-like [Camelina sativa]|uniref:F-box/kelch-repeat protein At1g64840-like n=1 Tax=Camelina sativa TaxID=90675 RepID=A0ABM0TPU0_CAMSA|nr:PREDICTED: F-box/kelch-repeat protein At1g64840-like [Camelina sativa]XP_010429464.1 PREDICTED: F-box/kelch-repeat protein At1g64840-like [Camelina sativa]
MSSMMPDWSQLPEELLPLISKKLEDYCFDVVHARSVSRTWRSVFPFPSCLVRPSYSLPSFADFPLKSKELCTLEKVPLFLFRLRAPDASAALPFEYILGGIGRDDSVELLPSPLQCRVKVKIQGSEPTLMNMLDCQIIPLGHQYRMIGWDPERWIRYYRGVVFLPLNNDGEFVVLLSYAKVLLVLTSAEMRWKRLTNVPNYQCTDLVTYRGRFYAVFLTGKIVVIDPYSLEVTPLMPSQPLRSSNYLIPSGNDDELFLVENFNPIPDADELDFNRFTCRVSRLDEAAGVWVVVSDLGDRVLFVGHFGNTCCSAKELPDGCGVTGNSILYTNGGNVTFAYKYGVHTGRPEDELNIWRFSREKRVTILSTSPALALRVEDHFENLALDA